MESSGNNVDKMAENKDSAECPNSNQFKMNFEIFGKVQGVFFRKYTKQTADNLGIVGWVRNTRTGTVKGHAQGALEPIEHFREWLTNTGSPRSRIDDTYFSKLQEISEFTHSTFEIRRTK
mmetsp:Transcript_22840/g.34414  ORF Transcript_22840/g.34414 Transcript_22840/m.34414 type:complete len:120 (-) Transcript_22840:336-695(-)